MVGSNKDEFLMLSSSEGLDITRSKEIMVTYFQGFPRKHPEKIQTVLVPQALAAVGEGVAGRPCPA